MTKRYTKEQKQAIFQSFHSTDPCPTCSAGAECCGCPSKRTFESQFERARELGVLSEAKQFYSLWCAHRNTLKAKKAEDESRYQLLSLGVSESLLNEHRHLLPKW